MCWILLSKWDTPCWNMSFLFVGFFGTTPISPWAHKQPLQSLELHHLSVLACCSFPVPIPLPALAWGCIYSALLFFLLGVGFMSPCASQSLRLWGCFRNKSFYHPIAVLFNYPLLDGDVWKHKQKGFQQFSQCLNVWTTLRASCSILCHPSSICLSLISSAVLLSAHSVLMMFGSFKYF